MAIATLNDLLILENKVRKLEEKVQSLSIQIKAILDFKSKKVSKVKPSSSSNSKHSRILEVVLSYLSLARGINDLEKEDDYDEFSDEILNILQ